MLRILLHCIFLGDNQLPLLTKLFNTSTFYTTLCYRVTDLPFSLTQKLIFEKNVISEMKKMWPQNLLLNLANLSWRRLALVTRYRKRKSDSEWSS
jgi:hypothetical protein